MRLLKSGGVQLVSWLSLQHLVRRLHLVLISMPRGVHGSGSYPPDSKCHPPVHSQNTGRDYLRDVSVRHHDMKAPKVHDNLSWKKQKMPSKEAGVISAAMATLNQFSNNGSFLHEVQKQNEKVDNSVGYTNCEDKSKPELVSLEFNIASEEIPLVKDGLSANQLAAKAMQLRMKGKHEAEILMQETERMKAKQHQSSIRPRNEGSASRLLMKDMSSIEKKREDDADVHLARNIMQNKQYSMSGLTDDEYDYEDGPSRKSHKK